MLLFRSEEHLESWLDAGRGPRGERFGVDVQWELARSWFTGRDRPEWRRRTAAEAEEVFRSAGLTGPFWSLR